MSPLELQLDLQHPPQASHSNRGSPRGRQHSVPAPAVEFHSFDDVDITSSIRPPPSALTATAATAYDPHSDAPSPLQDYPRSAPSSHQRTLTGTFFDNLTRATSTLQHHRSRTSLHSPTKSLASFIPSRPAVESAASQPKIRALQNWFNGSSGPVKIGVSQSGEDSETGEGSESGSEVGSEYYSSDEEEEEEEEHEERGNMMANLFNRGSSLTRGLSQSPTRRPEGPATPTKTPNPSTPSTRFAWLLSTQKNAVLPPPVASPTYHNPDDELLNLNISQALFPHGPADPLAPSSFHDLLTNAEALLARYQSSYRQLSTTLVDVQSEQSAQDDELDEAETRARHLKMQLETMAARATEQDEQMRKLMEDLTFERRARQDEEAARKRNMALIRGCEHAPCQTTPRKHTRVSNSQMSVDSGFESECETDATSLFSPNCLSPAGTERSSSILDSDPLDTTPTNRKSNFLKRGSTYDKPRNAAVNFAQGCDNCEGGSQAAVWGRLSREREENRVLRQRVETLEEAVESALNVVDGPWGL
ncbi:hypothetical protein P153DRAFT_376725 [Dothidotthia symphoricarpi CBS 119687]|uniref:Uncharacterized protein n=1 Tax=Dothidotthia symphoricarpi CBS 119687 TaxID=1392245 RepID=A0A6A6ACL4_9PLEO|nr:uncharacterized protein P153DRAFT_376725 [Dothidotthia symphoricarpi CBS 119687]KAF2128617.1 hypothetical protein P153DRAFT_376725 [Dothidotthia symphoricarpi CBS 119687]